MANRQGYRAIEAAAEALGWPVHWRTDLTTHDRRTLSRAAAPQTFGWAVRETGTWLYIPGDICSLLWARATVIEDCPERRYFWYDGSRLREVSAGESMQLLTPDYWRDTTGNQYTLEGISNDAGEVRVLHIADASGPLDEPRRLRWRRDVIEGLSPVWAR